MIRTAPHPVLWMLFVLALFRVIANVLNRFGVRANGSVPSANAGKPQSLTEPEEERQNKI